MERDLAKRIGQNTRAARQAQGLTQADAAERVGVSSEFYGRLERGTSMPSVPTLVRLAEGLATTPDVLLGFAAAPAAAKKATPPRGGRDRVLDRRLRRASPAALQLVRLLLGELEKGEGRRRRAGAGDKTRKRATRA